jgi:DNA-binding IclR family transcriptional regulator
MGVAGSYYAGSNYKIREIGKDKVAPKGEKLAYHNSMEKVINTAKPFLKELHSQLGDSVYLGIKKEKTVLYLMHYDSIKEVRISGCVGGEYPLHTSAPGKILLAWSKDEEIDDYFNSKASNFIMEAIQIKEQLYAIDNEEYGKGIICYSAPIFNSSGDVIAAIGVSTLTIYDDISSLISTKGKLVSAYANKISEALGFYIKNQK